MQKTRSLSGFLKLAGRERMIRLRLSLRVVGAAHTVSLRSAQTSSPEVLILLATDAKNPLIERVS